MSPALAAPTSTPSGGIAPARLVGTIYDHLHSMCLTEDHATIPHGLNVGEQVEYLQRELDLRLESGRKYFLLAIHVPEEVAVQLNNRIEGKVKIMTFYEIDKFTGCVALFVSHDPTPPHVMPYMDLQDELIRALKLGLSTHVDDVIADRVMARGRVDIRYRDPQARHLNKKAEVTRIKWPDFSIHHGAIRPRSGYAVLHGECAHANESFQALIDELRAVVEGSTNRMTKIAIGIKVECLNEADGKFQQPRLQLVAVSWTADDQRVVLHGPLLYSLDSDCQTAGMEAFSVRLRLRAFLRGSGLEDRVGNAWATADLFTANMRTGESLAWCTGEGLKAQPEERDRQWENDCEQVMQEYATMYGLTREQEFGTPQLPEELLLLSFGKNQLQPGNN